MKLIATTVSTTAITLLAASLVAGDPVNVTSQPPARATTFSTPTAVPPGDCFAVAAGMDLPGNDIGSQQEVDYNHCWSYCDSNPSCKAWTWSSYQGGTCWLKGGHGRAIFDAGAVSGVKFPSCFEPRGSQYLVVDNCDMLGYDRDSRPGRSYWDCMGVSAASFMWSDANGGTCWFKTATVPCQYAQNKYTGVLLR